VAFVVIGGLAVTVAGSARATSDVDVVYARDAENIERLVAALRPYKPSVSGAPPGLPFLWDAQTVRTGLNFTLVTELGALDLLGEVTGGGTYEELLPYCQRIEAFGTRLHLPGSGGAYPGQARRRAPQGLRGHRRTGSHPRGTPEARGVDS